ncbi:MAG: type II secretion system protein GspN [Bacteriovoracaceae bacterium]|jgi:type II secretion system protein N|nr:type II secretion system protein GspN [Bacteriovoracaceae bacterium]
MHRPDKENNDIYTLGRFPIKRTLTISATLLFLGFFFNFPISQIIKENVAKSISSLKIRGCPISYSKIEVEYFFFPKVILKKPSISGNCFGNPKEKIDFKELMVKLYIPSFWPPGIRLHAPVKYKKTHLDIYLTKGLGKMHANIKDSNVNGKFISKFSSVVKDIQGDININTLASMTNNGPTDGDILLTSKNIKLGSQNIMGVQLPSLSIGDFLFKAEFKRPKLKIMELKIGNKTSPFKAKMTGTINYNNKYPKRSEINLKGSIFFSQNFISEFPILNIILAGKNANSEGGYNIELTGTLGAFKHKFK